MKNITVLLITGFFLFLGACDKDEFLDRSPLANPSPESFFVNESTARMAVNSCYQPWQWGSGGDGSMLYRDMTILLDAMTDDSYWRQSRGTSIQLEKWDISPTHYNVRDWWRFPYQSINAANFAIERIPTSTDPNFTPEKQEPYIAEAKFFRAYGYLWLTGFYGDVPLLLGTTSDFSEFYTPISPKATILAQVVQDFKDAKDGLPAVQIDKGTPVKAAAAAFLAKTYLVLGEWGNAETAAREAIQIAEGAGFGLQDDFLSIWSEEENSELLFYWSFAPVRPYGHNMSVQRLCRDMPGTMKIAINGDGWGYALPQRDLYDEFEEGDPRREFTMYSPGHDYEIYPGADFDYTHEILDDAGDTVRWDVTYKAGDMVEYDYRWSPTGLNVRKMTRHVKDLASVQQSGLDIPAMRMGEVYLLLAEALAEQGDNEALIWVNKVRARPSVNMPPVTSGNLVDIVRHERRVELAMEGLRIHDLLRWGILDDVFGDGTKVKRNFYSDFLDAGSSLKYDSPTGNLTYDPIFPIPQIEIDNNPNINVNNGDWQ